MTSLLSVVTAIALAADPAAQGLPFGVPPAPEDAVIAGVAPPQCLFYLNWAGTASPSATSGSETEKLLAEPEVQEFLRAVSRTIVAYVRKGETKKAATATVETQLGEPKTGGVGKSEADRQQALILMREIRVALAANQVGQAEALCRRLDEMRIPESAFAPGEDTPAHVFAAVHQAQRRFAMGAAQPAGEPQTAGPMQAAAVVPAGGTTEAGSGAQSAQNKALATKLAEQPAAAGTLSAIARADNPNQQAAIQIRDQLRASGQSRGRKITVRYANGTVWLQGQVPNREHYNAVVAAVMATQGVTITQVVTEELKVDGAASSAPLAATIPLRGPDRQLFDGNVQAPPSSSNARGAMSRAIVQVAQTPGIDYPPSVNHVHIVERIGTVTLPHCDAAGPQKLPAPAGGAVPPRPAAEPTPLRPRTAPPRR